ncbi:MAG: hypothetical protein ACETWK_10085 [Candidatus Aminicenantaceae bacterium]
MKRPLFAKVLLLFILILTLSFAGFSKKKLITSSWTNIPINIDGSSDDWEYSALNSEKNVSVDYGLKNDSENLFILFVFKDPKYLSTIKATGMTLWFNLEGKKNKIYGIKFIKQQVPAEEFISILEQEKGSLSEEEKNNVRANPYYFLHNIKVINKKSKSSTEVSDSARLKPAVFRSMKSENMHIYEFAVPLNRATEQAPGVGAEPGKTIKICFEWGGMTEAMKTARMKRLSDTGGGPQDPRRSGGSWSKGSSYSKRVPRVSPGVTKYSIWVDIQLAKNQ